MTVHIDQGETGGRTRVNLSETVADYQFEHNPDMYKVDLGSWYLLTLVISVSTPWLSYDETTATAAL